MTDRQAAWICVFIVVSVVAALVGVSAWRNHAEEECRKVGGELKSYGRTYLCISPDGRVLDR